MAARISRYCLYIVIALSCSAASAETTTGRPDSPYCLYDSRTFSEGALICVRKSVMLNCSSDGTHTAWKIVADRELSDRCEAPSASVRAHRFIRHARIARTSPPPLDSAAKCFMFNGNRYCE